MLQSVPLFSNYKERAFALVALFLLFGFNLFLEYRGYTKFFDQKRRFVAAEVLNQYKKPDRTILKFQSQGVIFYSSSKEDLKDLRSRRVVLLLFRPRKIPSFWQYLSGFYMPSYIVRVYPADSIKEQFLQKIALQHTKPFFKDLFGALYLAKQLTKEERKYINLFGIAHLIAISGFHLGLLVFLVSFIVVLGLKPLWQRVFPYRNIVKFATMVSIVAALIYIMLLGPLPALLRSFVMIVAAFFLAYRHIKVLSFESLFWVVLLLLVLFPRLLFSIGFLLSVAGVFYIYLFLHLFRFRSWLSIVFINLWLYVTMLPFSLYLFHQWSYYQFLSPLLSLLFILFYPVSLLLHLFSLGGMLDQFLKFLQFKAAFIYLDFPFWLFLLYIGLSLLAIKIKRATIFAVAIPVVFLVYHIT